MSSTLLVVVLLQKKTLVDYVGHDNESALYMSELTDGGGLPLRVLLPMDAYDDFGRPEQLTVTLRPGSHFEDADRAFEVPSAG